MGGAQATVPVYNVELLPAADGAELSWDNNGLVLSMDVLVGMFVITSPYT